MKFGEHMDLNMWPYWRSYYINYKLLKKALKHPSIRILSKTSEAVSSEYQSPVCVVLDAALSPQHVLLGGKSLFDVKKNGSNSCLIQNAFDDDQNDLKLQKVNQHLQACMEADRLFRSIIDKEVAKTELFLMQQVLTVLVQSHDVLVLSPLPDKKWSSTRQTCLDKIQNICVRLLNRSLMLSEHQCRCPVCKEECSSIEVNSAHLMAHVFGKPIDDMLDSERVFCGLPKNTKIKDMNGNNGNNNNETSSGSISSPSSHVLKALKFNHGSSKKEKRVRERYSQIATDLALIVNFAIMNHTACYKILKKFRKATKQDAHVFMKEVIEMMFFSFAIPDLQAIFKSMEEFFYELHRKPGAKLTLLHDLENKSSPTSQIMWAGCLIGATVVMICITLFEYIFNFPQDGEEGHTAFDDNMLTMFRWTGMPVVLLVLFSFDALIWQIYRVNYIYIFGFGSKKASPVDLLTGSFFMLLSWLVLVFVYIRGKSLHVQHHLLSVGETHSFKQLGFLPYLTTALILFLSIVLAIPRTSAGRWLWLVMWRLFPPRFPVLFGDFFIGDQLTSIGPMLYDSQFVMCIWYNREALGYCGNKHVWYIPIISNIPNIIRFLQCLRRLHGEHKRDGEWQWDHGWNAGKYFSAMVSGGFEFLNSLNVYGGCLELWLITNFISTLYRLFWDLCKDWGLFCRGHKGLRSKDKMMFPILWYYFAIVFNTILRFSWVFMIYIKAHSDEDSTTDQLVIYMWPFLEIVRRAVWNIFRVENEHVNNCGRFRPVNFIPLPLAVMRLANIQDDDHTQENDELAQHHTTSSDASSAASVLAKSFILRKKNKVKFQDEVVPDDDDDTNPLSLSDDLKNVRGEHSLLLNMAPDNMSFMVSSFNLGMETTMQEKVLSIISSLADLETGNSSSSVEIAQTPSGLSHTNPNSSSFSFMQGLQHSISFGHSSSNLSSCSPVSNSSNSNINNKQLQD